MRRGQSALEFLILAGFMFVALTMVLVVLNAQSDFEHKQLRQRELSNIGDTLLQEVLNAHRVHDGYERTFTLPPTVNGEPYMLVLLSSREIEITSADDKYVLFLPANVTLATQSGSTPYGTLAPGPIQITKQQSIQLNVPP